MKKIGMEEKLAAYMEGSLSQEERSLIEEQLKQSQQLRETLTDLTKTTQLLEGLEEVETPSLFTERIMSRVREESRQRNWIFDVLCFRPNTKFPIQAIAAILIAVASILIYRAYQPEPDRLRSDHTLDPQPQTEEIWGDVRIILDVNDIEDANIEIQTAVSGLGGIVLRKQSFENRNVLFVLIDSQKTGELYEKFELIGELNREVRSSAARGNVKVKIEIVNENPSIEK